MSVVKVVRRCCALTKPGIIFGNGVTLWGGFAMGSKDTFKLELFSSILVGLSLIIASACIVNNYIDRKTDAQMVRTQHRPIATGTVSFVQAMGLAFILGVCGIGILVVTSTLVIVSMAFFGFCAYVLLYGLGKYISVHATLLGGMAGAIPPALGYCASSNLCDAGAYLLFLSMVVWQMPHFYSIAIYRLEEYSKTSISILPIQRGIFVTKVYMTGYILSFIVLSVLCTVLGYTGSVYTIVTMSLGSLWLIFCIVGLRWCSERNWARYMFYLSLVVLFSMNIAIVLGRGFLIVS